jgi:MYXO-CTERM domain-containing protein
MTVRDASMNAMDAGERAKDATASGLDAGAAAKDAAATTTELVGASGCSLTSHRAEREGASLVGLAALGLVATRRRRRRERRRRGAEPVRGS